ncbi:MAG: hypothetical protein AAGA11_04490 [Pseudomonadota bacterium]
MTERNAITFYRDATGQPRAGGADTALATFLETDCQGSEHHTDAILAALDTGRDAVFTGNAHELQLSGARATITPLAHEDAAVRQLSTATLARALRRWRDFTAAPP